MFAWDPHSYLEFDDARSRPGIDLLARIPVTAPTVVYDLGCGPGGLTAVLRARWPAARVIGTDNSPEMLAAASVPDVRFELQDIRDWVPPDEISVAVCNAVLQWVPGQLRLVTSWARQLAAGSSLGWQVPANFDSPSHTLITELAPQFGVNTRVLSQPPSTPQQYAEVLLDAGLMADVWQTSYLHVLTGEDPVLRWMRGTALRPVLAQLDPDAGQRFQTAYASRLREAFPRRADGTTLLPYRRTFAVGTRS